MSDFDDRYEVLEEVARDLGIDPSELDIITNTALESFGAGDVYEIRFKHKPHGKTWNVVESEEVFRDLALEVVKQDLEQEPEIFEKSFLEQHINMDRLRRDLESDVLNSRIDDLTDLADRHPDDFWDEYEHEGLEAPEEDEDGERPEPEQEQIEELAERQVEAQLRDPMSYLEDIYGREDAVKQAIEIAGIDIDAAAEDAVDTDGAEHFLARYDGNSHETSSGLVYWRDN
jgi:hypothetical protein